MSKNRKICLVIGMVIVVLITIGSIGFYRHTTKKLPNNDYEEFNYEELNYQLQICKDESGVYVYNENYIDRTCEDLVNIPTKMENAKLLYKIEDFVLYEDVGLKIYNIQNKKYMKVNLENEYNIYVLNLNFNKDAVDGIIYTTQDGYGLETGTHYGYYSIKKEKKLYDNEYDYLRILNEEFIVGSRFILNQDDDIKNVELFILSTDNEKVIGNKLGTTIRSSFDYENGFILYSDPMNSTNPLISTKEIYTNDFKIIENDVKDYEITPNKELYNLEGDKVKVYNSKGDVLKTHLVSGDIIKIFHDYYLTSYDESLYIRDYDGYVLKLGSYKKDEEYGIDNLINYGYSENKYYENKYFFIFRIDETNNGYDAIEYTFNTETKQAESRLMYRMDLR